MELNIYKSFSLVPFKSTLNTTAINVYSIGIASGFYIYVNFNNSDFL